MTTPVISVEKLSKRFRIRAQQQHPETLRELIIASARSPFAYLREMTRPPTEAETLWALKDVSFEVCRGEVVGLIGRNGAGKSTLLKMLARIMDPTEGRAVLRGRVGSLLEVGTGFHPELTGRENVFLNGAILGMKKREIEAKFDQIVAFADVTKFLDTPVKRYSSGMTVRLAFAVAAHLDPEILIVDEVLSVGDAAFQRKSLGRMESLAGHGRTVLFVSHSMPAVQALCHRVMLFENGRIAAMGDPATIIEQYLKTTELGEGNGFCDLSAHPNRITDTAASIFRSLRLINRQGETSGFFAMGEPIAFEIELDMGDLQLENPLVNIEVEKQGTPVCFLPTTFMINRDYRLSGRVRARCVWQPDWLAPGRYVVKRLSIKRYRGAARLDQIEHVTTFEIVARDVYGTGKMTHDGALLLPHGHWEFSQLEAAG